MRTGFLRSSAILLASLLIYSPLVSNQPSRAAGSKDKAAKNKSIKTNAADKTDLHKASTQAILHPLDPLAMSREEEGARDLNEVQSRCWKVVNQNSRKYLGHFPGYVLHPQTNAYPLSHPDSYNRKRASFLAHHFWTTRFNPEELYAGGEYPVSSTGGEGLPKWVNDDSIDNSIDNEDLVLWYTVGITHVPRVEDWPIMPSATMGFKISPEEFFTRNPALDVPEAQNPLTDPATAKPAKSLRNRAGMR